MSISPNSYDKYDKIVKWDVMTGFEPRHLYVTL